MQVGRRLRRIASRGGGGDPGGAPQAFPAGAFYSPVVNAREVLTEPDRSRIWPAVPRDPVGIDVREAEQLALLQALAAFPFPHQRPDGDGQYDAANDQFPPHDACLLYALVRHCAPPRMVEVGCGWSTTVTAAAIRDGNLPTQLTCIEPYPRPFLRTMSDVLTLREERVEHAPMSLFENLDAGDVLFIDSSHVAKTGSDVVHQFLEVLPRLADGVLVHVHDIFLPQDYPQRWVRAGFNWNEQYLLQAYLAGNSRACVVAMNQWLALRHPDAVRAAFGDVELNGSSFWFVTGSEPGVVR